MSIKNKISNGVNDKKNLHLKMKICVSGAAETGHCGPDSLKKAEELGREIAHQNIILINGATTGFPLWSAKGAKNEGGITVGFSPASCKKEHVQDYKLPLEYLDFIIFTGFGYSGRNLLLTRAADAVIIGCGRMGTINEFTIAFEDNKPIGILKGDWQTDEVAEKIIKEAHRGAGKVVYDSDPKKLVEKVVDLIKKEK